MRRYLADTKTRTSLEQLIIAESSIAPHRLTLRGHFEWWTPAQAGNGRYRLRPRGGEGHVAA